MKELVLIRHGESQWNKENRFTGWSDVDLSERGVIEAREAGKILKTEGYTFDVAFTSVLKRAIKTLFFVLDEIDLLWIPIHKTYRLNERHYGALQGLNKSETAEKYGEQQVKVWRRSYDVLPMPLSKEDGRYPKNDVKYKDIDEQYLPLAESLKDTIERVIPCWEDEIVPLIKEDKKLIIAAHGNSLRALIKYLDNLNNEEIMELNIPTGTPLVYEFDNEIKPIKKFYLGNPDKIKKEIDDVMMQGKNFSVDNVAID
jgi:2,3-bisphosphoglycerate-dependent phosphoglycerate mutase